MKKSDQVTIYDVAKEAGVSPATVSRVMNEPSRVAVEKKDAVFAAIKKLNFVPKADAVINARHTYKKIGVVAPFFTQASFMERMRGVSEVLGREHYELVLYSIDKTDDLKNYINALVATNRVDGLIFLCVHLEEDVLTVLRSAKFPVCFVEEAASGFDNVIVKNLEGGQKAAEYLYGIGCRRPGFIGEKSSLSYAVSATEERFRGYEFYFANQGIVIQDKHVWIGDFTEKKLDEGIRDFLKQAELPDCVFCSSDLIAARFIALAREKGIGIPSEVKVLGFDNIDIAQYIGLSSVSQNLDDSGKMAAELILSKIKSENRTVANMVLPLDIIERESTKTAVE